MNILTLGPDYWEGQRHNRQYFCEELSKSNRVLFVSPPFYLVDLIRSHGKGRIPVRSGLTKMNDNLKAYIPPKFLFTNYRYPRINNAMRQARVCRIKKIMKSWAFYNPILLVWHPAYSDMIGHFGEKLVVYYVYDNYSGYVGGDPGKPDIAEIELLKKADIVFVLSKELYEQKKQWASDIYHLPNAVDYDLFSGSRDPITEIPNDIANLSRPVIGYIGTINEKVDVPLLDYISGKRRDWSILLIGRENYQVNEMKRQFYKLLSKSNVYWLGYKHYASIPNYIKGLDICMMCYIINDWTYFGDPSKMHEYLASGKPVIATALPAIREFSDVIVIPETKEGWVEAIDEALRETDSQKVQHRIDVAIENSYQNRVRTAIGIINKKLISKYGQDYDQTR
jgi:glycosyltransferase involved in cell wall biosynthesis